jgi:hypothetical protein
MSPFIPISSFNLFLFTCPSQLTVSLLISFLLYFACALLLEVRQLHPLYLLYLWLLAYPQHEAL